MSTEVNNSRVALLNSRVTLLTSIANTVVSNYLSQINGKEGLIIGTNVVSNNQINHHVLVKGKKEEWVEKRHSLLLSQLAPLLINDKYVIPAKPRNLSGSKKHTDGIVVDLGSFILCLFVRKDEQIRIILDKNVRKSMEDFCVKRLHVSSYGILRLAK